MEKRTPAPYAIAQRSWRHVFVHDLKLVSPVENRRLRINLDMAVIEETNAVGDHLANVVCYEKMATNIRQLVVTGKISTDKALAERIASMSLDDSRVRRVRVRVESLEAWRDTVGTSVEIERSNV